MSTLNDVVITKLSGGLGRRNPEQDMVSGLLFSGLETSSLKFDTIKRIASLEDAEALGIDESYDINGQSAYYQIQQFFRMNPSGDLYVMLVGTEVYGDTVKKAMSMQEKANGNIRQMAIIFSGDTTFAQTKAALAIAQEQADLAYTDYMPFEIILEGKGFNAAVETDSPSLALLNSENVSVVIAMDVEKAFEQKLIQQDTNKAYILKSGEELVPSQSSSDIYNVRDADGLKKDGSVVLEFAFQESYKNTAAVGLALGALSKAKVSENIAWIEKFNLTGNGFAKPGFVGGKEIKSLGDLRTLNEKRYIFTQTHTGLAGVYFNDSHTCTTGTSDFAYIENNRTVNKATRLLRTALLPKLASPVLVDIDGKLPQSVSKSFEDLCRNALEGMVANQEVSAFDVYVDPKQNILATSELKVKAEITPIGTARKIMVDLGFKNPFGIDKA
ncbi:DUF2586 domain-containing protein [Flavobacterium nitrogenifigens]|uniref:DUF2586 family protein n=1 Tax=Flavobacterium nitrogenifigens TaxID=1617283 RepID=A0A521FAL0_9FLAO|nr:DUF2586 domain-containing protein [Flavobacterium nitrogenifigens]KAF2337978.1 DUF2586 family protein [Flavobacterium nitrogenifigens]SMO93196.1 Protein of unknown function [Flavobacterium nitrogenifigens]